MVDVLIAGAGPAGAVAALVLARAGVDVLVVDRARFPRDKLCGDTLNPGAIALLRRLGIAGAIESASLALDGILLTGATGVSVDVRYPAPFAGRAMSRRVLDGLLLDAAVRAGARVELGAAVTAPIVETVAGVTRVAGATVRMPGGDVRIPAAVTIAADGRRSTLAFSLGLARHPRTPRRWAVGTRYEGVDGLAARGEMHIRSGHYVGIAPLPGGLANVCVVTPCRAGFDEPAAVVARALAGDALLRDRFASARGVEPCTVLGPLAVDARAAGMPGLLLAGDAAGFIDPMTGDGLRFAIGGGWLAAQTAVDWLARPELPAWAHLAHRRHRAFGWKRRFDRVLRRVVASPASIRVAAAGAAIAPILARQLVTLAGDVPLARRLEAR